MPLNFPASPSLNDVYTYNQRTWIWNGSAWDIQPTGAINSIVIGKALEDCAEGVESTIEVVVGRL